MLTQHHTNGEARRGIPAIALILCIAIIIADRSVHFSIRPHGVTRLPVSMVTRRAGSPAALAEKTLKTFSLSGVDSTKSR